jgi:hypothetical protein
MTEKDFTSNPPAGRPARQKRFWRDFSFAAIKQRCNGVFIV